ncbi:MAG: TIGR02677 family protein [Trueperaceae bacterium]|nr:MAG: TIGR02677 family protein [Trueperaceae bacterium]
MQPAGDTPTAAPERFDVFAHLSTEGAAAYRRILAAFVTAKERFHVHLRPEDVASSLHHDGGATIEADELAAKLDSLERWGNLRSHPDTSRVTAVEDFYRRRLLYGLTHEGEAAERALRAFDEALGRRGALQAVALADVELGLRELQQLAAADDPDLGKLRQTLNALTGRFNDLAENASAFMASLQRSIDLEGTSEDAFIAYKDKLIEYLERFIQDLVTIGASIAGLIRDADVDRMASLLDLVAAEEAADEAPDPDDPEARRALERARERWRNRWRGLEGWFVSSGAHESQAKLLRTRALAAIPALLDVVREVNVRRAGRSDRSADFLTLARWFAAAPSDGDRHRLWHAAFGLDPARHLAVDAATLQRWAERPRTVGAPWAEAEPIAVSPQLRRTGSYERRGKPNRVVDRSEHKAQLAARATHEAEQVARARETLVTDGPLRLSELAHLDAHAFALFLDLLGDALAARRPGAQRSEVSAGDGSLRIRLSAIEGAPVVAIRSARGTLRGPDHIVEIFEPEVYETGSSPRDEREAVAARPHSRRIA